MDNFKISGISFSLLSTLSNPVLTKKGLDGERENIEARHFRIGGAIDCILTTPDKGDDKYFVTESERPTGLLGSFVDNLPCGLTPKSPINAYKDAYEKSGYKYPIKRAISVFGGSTLAKRFYKEKCAIGDREVLSADEFEVAKNATVALLNSPYTNRYFKPNEHEKVFYQTKIKFEFEDVPCKAFLDGVTIDYEDRTIQPWDLKSTGKGIMSFPKSFKQYGYYRQAAFYTKAIELLPFYSEPDNAISEAVAENFTIKPFQFLVVETVKEQKIPPIVYQCSKRDLDVGLYGGTYNGVTIKGIVQLIDDLKWHIETNNGELPKEVYLNKGVVDLNLFD